MGVSLSGVNTNQVTIVPKRKITAMIIPSVIPKRLNSLLCILQYIYLLIKELL
jgi:hypothetical protein